MHLHLRPVSVACALALVTLAAQSQPAAPARAAPATTAPATVAVSSVEVTGNTLLPASAIAAVTAPVKGQVSLADLERAAAALQQLYRDAGYGGVVAFVPEQPVSNGVARISVLEGRIAKVDVIGNTRSDTAQVRRSVPLLKEGVTPQVSRIDSQIQMANENAPRQLAVTLEPGARPGEVDARVTVTEGEPQRWTFSADNTGTESTGRFRVGVGYSHGALFGADHLLTLQAQTSPENPSEALIAAAGYRIPFYDAGLVLEAYAGYSEVDNGGTTTVAGPLNFSGEGSVAGLRLTRPLPRQGEWDHRIAFAIDRRDYVNSCFIGGLPDGACGPAGENVSVTPISVDYTAQNGGPVPAGGSIGLSWNPFLWGPNGQAANFEAVRPGADPNYTTVRASGYVLPPVGKDWRLELRGALQYTRDALVSSEQFGIAGANFVRGYDEREIAGDSGIVASLELRSPEMSKGGNPGIQDIRLLGFLDVGQARNRLDTPCNGVDDRCTLASVGTGVRVLAGGLQFKLDLAFALKQAVDTQRGDARAHFQIVYQLP